MLLKDIGLLIFVYLISLWWQWICYPFLYRLRHIFVDSGWALGRIFITLGISLVIWTVSNTGLGINNDVVLFFLISASSLVSLFFWKNNYTEYLRSIKERGSFILTEEVLMLAAIVSMGIIRGFGPDLNDAEKFMDLGFIKQYLSSVNLPVPDMWMAGKTINYYSFGHFWLSIIIRWVFVSAEVGYNLMVGLIFGLVLTLTFSFTVNLLDQRYRRLLIIAGGLISALMVAVGGNGHIWWFLIKNKGLFEGNYPYWYGLATRFIDGTITEFPSYTFSIGDLHPHLIDLPIVLATLILLVGYSKNHKDGLFTKLYLSLLGLFLGVMLMTNTWDGGIYLLFWFIFQLVRFVRREITLKKAVAETLIILVVSFLVSATWWIGFIPIPQGIGIVLHRSPLWQLLVLWSIHLVIGLLAVSLKGRSIIYTILITAVTLIAIPEFVYVKDILSETPRINTVFKLTFQSFVLLSILFGPVVVELVEKKRFAYLFAVIVAVAGLLVFPFTSYPNNYRYFTKYQGLDGGQWLLRDESEEFYMAKYLNENRDGRYLIEFPGQSFTLHNSVSVFSGVPSVLGWREHEWLWRNWPEVRERIEDIDLFYLADKSIKIRLIKKYRIGWVKVGDKERNNLTVNDTSFIGLGDIVWQDKGNYLLKLKNEY